MLSCESISGLSIPIKSIASKMATILRFEDLEIWQLARKIYSRILTISEKMKKNHDFKFSEQIKGSAGSAMDNIREGFERSSRLEFINSLSISKGECGELKSQLYRALDGNYIDQKEFDEIYANVELEIKKLAAFIIYLNTSSVKGLKFKNRK